MRKPITSAAVIFFLSLASVSHAEDWYVARTGANNIYAATLGSSCLSWTGFIPTGTYPVALAINPAGSRVYVANYASTPMPGGDSVTVIDTATSTPIKTITGISAPTDVVVSASRAYVSSANRVHIIDTVSNTLIGNVTLPGTVARLAFNATTNRLFATTYSSLVVIDAATNSVVNTIPLDNAGDVAVTPDGKLAYVARSTPGPVAVVSLESNNVVATITVDGIPTAVAINPEGTRVFVAVNRNTGGVGRIGGMSAVDVSNNTIITTVNTGISPYEIAAGRDWIMVSNSGAGVNDGSVTQITASGFATNEFVVGGLPAGVAVFERPLPPPAVAEAEVTGIEVTQGIQDLAQSVGLVANRRTFVRVYVRAKNLGALPPITAYIFGTAGTSAYGPLTPANTVPAIGIPASQKRFKLDDSFYFALPTYWANKEKGLRINVELQRAGEPAPFCNYNGPNKTVGFRDGAILNYQFVRMKYDWALSPREASVVDQLNAESMIYRLYPVSRVIHHKADVRTLPSLGRHVERTHKDCSKYLPAEDIGACAADYVNVWLGLEHMGGYVDADGGYGLIPQVPATLDPTGKYFTRGACCFYDFSSGPATDPITAAHEIGHRFGRNHPIEGSDTCGHKGKDNNYPYPWTAIHPLFPYDPNTGLAGFDMGDHIVSHEDDDGDGDIDDHDIIIPPMAFAPEGVFDYMGYCKPTQWTSDYTYNAMYDALRAARPYDQKISRGPGAQARAINPQAGDWLLIGGSFEPGRAGSALLHALRAGLVTRIPDRVPGAYSIRLVDAGGAQLADYPFTPTLQADTAGASSRYAFMQAVAFVGGTREIRLVEVASNSVAASLPVSSGVPTVSNVALQGAVDPNTGEVTLNWTGSDPDNDELSYDIFVTRDSGATFEPLIYDASTNTSVVDTSHVGGGTASFRVRVSDGVNTATADSPSFSIPNKVPAVTIVNPGNGEQLNEGQALILEGYATDAQDDVIPDANLVWKIAGRTVGTGRNLDLRDLAVGAYPVTLTATNSAGLSSTASVTVNFNAIVADPEPTLSVGPATVSWQVAPGETQAQTRTVEIGNVGTGALQFNAQLAGAGSWLTMDVTSGTAPASITLTAAPAGIAAGTLKNATLTVTGVGSSGQQVTIPVALAVGNTRDGPVTVPPPPVVPAPTADAGADQTTTEGTGVTLSGAASTVAAGHTASYQWTQKQGTAVALTGATTMTAQFTAPKPSGNSEVLRFELAVSDDTGQRAVDEVSITVSPLPVQTPPPASPPPSKPPKGGGGALEWWTALMLLALLTIRRRGPARQPSRV